MIEASALRAQISQIDKFQQATNTFKGKFGFLPGDILASDATRFGFVARAGTAGRGDGNGLLEGYYYAGGRTYGWNQQGETIFFWRDLSDAKLIPNNFSTVTDTDPFPINTTALPLYIPPAVLGQSNYVITFSECQFDGQCFLAGQIANNNFFGLEKITAITDTPVGITNADKGLSVMQAYSIDKKIDDGIPNRGNVQAFYPYGSAAPSSYWSPNSASASSSTCFDTTNNSYSITQNNGTGMNCGLSFKFQ